MYFQEISIPPPRKGFFPTPPYPSGNSGKASYISLYFRIFQKPPSPKKFQSLLWGGVWIFFGTAHCKCDFKILNLIVENLVVQVCFVCINSTIFLAMIWFIKKFKQYIQGVFLNKYHIFTSGFWSWPSLSIISTLASSIGLGSVLARVSQIPSSFHTEEHGC